MVLSNLKTKRLPNIERCNSNPFLERLQPRSAHIYCPDEYTRNLILSLSAISLRMLLLIASTYDDKQGLCYCTYDLVKATLNTRKTHTANAVNELAKLGLIAKGKKLYTYYINPKAFRPITIDF